MATRNLYLVLGVPRTASRSEIHDAYRRIAKERHPDVAGAGSTAAFQDLVDAYAVLSDPRLRRRHDAALAREHRPVRVKSRVGRSAPAAGRPTDLGSATDWGWVALGFPAFGSLFDALGAVEARPVSNPAAPAHLEVELDAEQAARGCRLELPLTLRKACAACDGGRAIWRAACPVCTGAGAVELTRREVFDIPAGTTDGTWLEYRIRMGTAHHALEVHQQDHGLARLRVRVRTSDRPPDGKEMRT